MFVHALLAGHDGESSLSIAPSLRARTLDHDGHVVRESLYEGSAGDVLVRRDV